tara:strand:+ start:377 stop:553 length:177 start_codon:yes stop_codon:yes gene_type:complete
MPGKGKLSYKNKEACIADAKEKGMDMNLCLNLPSKNAKGMNKPGTFQPGKMKKSGMGY